MADKTILDLTTDDERQVIKIDGTPYPIRTSADLTLEQFRYLEGASLRAGKLLQLPTLSKRDDRELGELLERIAAIALDAPAAVLAKLSPIQRVLVFKVFSELLTPALILATRAITAAPLAPSLGMRPSPDSSGSMAGTSKRGSRGRR